jgi:heavy metal sensor kinase
MDKLRRSLARLPIRARLTLWFVAIMGATLVALSLYLSLQFLHSVSSSIDLGLQIAAGQILANVEQEGGRLAFGEGAATAAGQQSSPGLTMRLVDLAGNVLDQRGIAGELPAWGPLQAGYATASWPGDDTRWRTLTEAVQGDDGSPKGWLQVVQTLDVLTNTQQDVRDQLLLMIPVLLVALGVGGYFLASRMLRPIDRITRTAATITASDLSKRIDFAGPKDEVGRLAATFDAMLVRLQSAFARERRFSADAAHELKTPLSVLKGKLDVALSRERSVGEYRATLQDLSAQVERLIKLSGNLLTLSRLEQRKLEGELALVNLSDMLESILEQYRQEAGKRQIAISADLPATLPMKGYPDALTRLFINLMDNAVRYTPEGGRIELKAAAGEELVWVALFNSATNLSDEQVRHLFERFYRADPSRSRRSGGAGLGLSIAKEIVEAHGGRIAVENRPGEGITFRIEMPSGVAQ